MTRKQIEEGSSTNWTFWGEKRNKTKDDASVQKIDKAGQKFDSGIG